MRSTPATTDPSGASNGCEPAARRSGHYCHLRRKPHPPVPNSHPAGHERHTGRRSEVEPSARTKFRLPAPPRQPTPQRTTHASSREEISVSAGGEPPSRAEASPTSLTRRASRAMSALRPRHAGLGSDLPSASRGGSWCRYVHGDSAPVRARSELLQNHGDDGHGTADARNRGRSTTDSQCGS